MSETESEVSAPRPSDLPLFPLRTVLFPDGLLELKIFETRYLDLMSACMREGRRFGVVALRQGSEARVSDDPVALHAAGTLAELIDVDSSGANLLEIRCRGSHRFTLGATRQQADGLWLGEASPIADDPRLPPRPAHAEAAPRLREAIEVLAAQGAEPFLQPHRLDDAGWIANRWCEILPLPLDAKLRLLTMADPLARLDIMASLLAPPGTAH